MVPLVTFGCHAPTAGRTISKRGRRVHKTRGGTRISALWCRVRDSSRGVLASVSECHLVHQAATFRNESSIKCCGGLPSSRQIPGKVGTAAPAGHALAQSDARVPLVVCAARLERQPSFCRTQPCLCVPSSPCSSSYPLIVRMGVIGADWSRQRYLIGGGVTATGAQRH
jgi:hypothetical protein